MKKKATPKSKAKDLRSKALTAGQERKVRGGAAGGAGSGKVKLHELTVTKTTDR